MTTEQTAQQLELAAQILRTGHPFEVRHDALNKWHASLGVKPETPAFQLPPPPPGMQWHRTDGWQERDLPQGMRPLVVNEESQPDDEHWTSDRGPWKALNRGGIIYDEGHTRCRTRRPLTFTHAGKTWTWHRPGDPRPCDGERKVVLLRTIRELSANDKYATLSKNWTWDDPLIIGWRYADEPKPKVPLGPEDIFPGCAIRAEKSEAWFTPTRVSVEGIHHANIGSGVQFTYFTSLHQARYEINRSLPTTGKWNPNAWEPCHKIISENG